MFEHGDDSGNWRPTPTAPLEEATTQIYNAGPVAFDGVTPQMPVSEGTVEPWRDRILCTLVFMDIVDSTERAVQLGDSRWRQLLENYYAEVRRQLVQFRGRELDTAGDGVFAAFDSPGRAIRCACRTVQLMRTLGIDMRIGLHTGECEIMGDKICGIAVYLGARIAAAAAPGEILVSNTVKDLVVGSGIRFADRGSYALKGIPGDWRLSAVVIDESIRSSCQTR